MYTTIKTTGTIAYTLKCGPSRYTWRGSCVGDMMTVVGTKKPRLKWWLELLVWYTWKRGRKIRIKIG